MTEDGVCCLGARPHIPLAEQDGVLPGVFVFEKAGEGVEFPSVLAVVWIFFADSASPAMTARSSRLFLLRARSGIRGDGKFIGNFVIVFSLSQLPAVFFRRRGLGENMVVVFSDISMVGLCEFNLLLFLMI